MTNTPLTTRRHLSGAMALVGAGILTAQLLTAAPENPEIRAVVQPVQFVAFTSPTAAQIRAAASDTIGKQSTGGPAQPFPIDLTVGDIAARIVEAVATAITAPFVIAFLAVAWAVSQLQRLVPHPVASVLSTARAAAATRTSAAKPGRPLTSRTRAHSSAASRTPHSSDNSAATKRAKHVAAGASATSSGRSARHSTSPAARP